MPEIRVQVHRWKVADYRVLAEDNPAFRHSELLRGIILDQDLRTPLHCYLAMALPTSSGRRCMPG